LRWLVTNIGTLLLAFLLAMVVWVSAVISADPNEVHVLPRLVPIEYIGQNPDLQIMGNPQTQVRLTLNAPKSVWVELNTNEEAVRAWVDLSGLGSGEHIIPIQVQINLDLVRLVQQDPQTLTLDLESLIKFWLRLW
jgi:YbbR domain-containing protein